MSDKASMRLAALTWSRRFGVAVFPIAPRAKVPLLPGGRGYLDATRDEAQIDAWWSSYPDANIGASAIASGVVVIDVDPRNGGDETIAAHERTHGKLPHTWTVLTPSGGWHLWFRAEDGASYRGSLGDGVDVKHRGYVLVPPSQGANGRAYACDLGAHPLETPLAAAPRVLLSPRAVRVVACETDARDSVLGHAFAAMGWLGDLLEGGRRAVRCPWAAEHTDGRGAGLDSSTVIFPRSVTATLGGFACAHGHCAGRTWREVLDVLPLAVRGRAELAMRSTRQRLLREAANG